jgi:hypothetical protein
MNKPWRTQPELSADRHVCRGHEKVVSDWHLWLVSRWLLVDVSDIVLTLSLTWFKCLLKTSRKCLVSRHVTDMSETFPTKVKDILNLQIALLATPSLQGRCICIADLNIMLWKDSSFDLQIWFWCYDKICSICDSRSSFELIKRCGWKGGMGMELYLAINVSIVWEDCGHCLFTIISRGDKYVKATVNVVDTIIVALFECVDCLLRYFLIFVNNDIKIRFRFN